MTGGAGARTGTTTSADVLVLGSGVAGATAALEVVRLAPGARVLLATKGALDDGSTARAQGGIAAVVDDDGDDGGRRAGDPLDSVALHVADTLAAGAGLCAPEAVAVLCAGGAGAVAALRGRGLALDTEGGRLARGLEAAHSRRRVLHAGGDVTGARIAAALGAALRASGVVLLTGAALVDLVTGESGGVGPARVVGARLLVAGAPGEAATELVVDAPAVVLATGGAGQLYEHTTTPGVATGDGLAAAARAGALVTDLEMVQFHPTLAVVGAGPAAPAGARFLVSEAVRGEGAVLRDETGAPFLREGPLAVPGAELAPRDVVARAAALAMAAQDGRPVLLDATALDRSLATGADGPGRGGGAGAGWLARRFPGIDALCRGAGLDWTREPVPVTPAAHYAMGGVRTDLRGRTSLPGLWAVGEVAWTGVHGANRLASNSLLEGAVFAARAAADVVAGGGRPCPTGPEGVVAVDAAGPALERRELQAAMWQHAGLVRDEAGLEVAAKALADPFPRALPVPHLTSPGARAPQNAGSWQHFAASRRQDPAFCGAGAGAGSGTGDWAGALREVEDANLTVVARLLVASARVRTESRGAHWRADHPRTAPTARHTTVAAVVR